MTKTATINTISSGYASQTQLNENFTNINNTLDNTLSLDGSTPNAMNAVLDLNNNDLLNVKAIYVDGVITGGILYGIVSPMEAGIFWAQEQL